MAKKKVKRKEEVKETQYEIKARKEREESQKRSELIKKNRKF